MSKVVKVGAMLLLAIGVSVGGCSSDGKKDGSTGAGTPAKTPKEAVVNFLKAAETGNKELLMANLEIPAEAKEFAEVFMGALIEMVGFADAMERTYGKESVQRLPSFESLRPFPRSADAAANVQIEERGDEAQAKVPGHPKPLDLARVNGVWKVKPKDLPTPERQQKEIAQGKAMTKAFRDARNNVGKPGMTAEKVWEDLNKVMSDVMRGTGEP